MDDAHAARAAAQAGLQIAVLKGVPLSFIIHGRLGLRISRDIDLLVAPDEPLESTAGVEFTSTGSSGFGACTPTVPSTLEM